MAHTAKQYEEELSELLIKLKSYRQRVERCYFTEVVLYRSIERVRKWKNIANNQKIRS